MTDTRSSLPRTILLLGGTGFVGTNLAARLSHSGHRVLSAGRTGGEGQIPALPLDDTEAILDLIRREGVDVVVHMVCAMTPASSLADFEREQDAVTLPTLRLGAGLARIDVGLIYLSSGGTVYGVGNGEPAQENDHCAPISSYGHAKLGIETDLAFLERTHGLRHLVVRPSNPFGLHQSLRGNQGLISVILGKIADDLPLEIWGDGSSVRDYIYIDDMVSSLQGLIERQIYGVTLNMGSGVGHSLLEVVDAVRAATGRRLEVVFRPARAVDVPRLVLDVSRLKKLGLHRTRPLEEGIRDYARALGMIDG